MPAWKASLNFIFRLHCDNRIIANVLHENRIVALQRPSETGLVCCGMLQQDGISDDVIYIDISVLSLRTQAAISWLDQRAVARRTAAATKAGKAV